MTSRVLELTPTMWDTMQRHLDHAEENHQKARSIKDEAHEWLTEVEDHASLATQAEQHALSRLEQWQHYDRRFKALCESIDQLGDKRVAHATRARTIHQQIDQAHAEANAIEGDDMRRAILIEKAELVEQEGRNRMDVEVRLAAEAEARLDREGQRLEELEREVEAAIADKQAQAQQQEAEAEVKAEAETTTH